MRVFKSLGVAFSALIMGGCEDSGGTNAPSVVSEASGYEDWPQPEVAEAANDDVPMEPPSPWWITTSPDPMTDEQMTTAQANLPADGYSVSVKISCSPQTPLGYEFATYDENNTGVPLRTRFFWGQNLGSIVLRIDKETAVDYTVHLNQYNNMVTVWTRDPSSPPSHLSALRLAAARTITIKFALKTGEPLLIIDQSDSALRPMLDKCIAYSKAFWRAKKAASKQPAPAPTPSDDNPTDAAPPSVEQETNNGGSLEPQSEG